jgi:hypothetical protein
LQAVAAGHPPGWREKLLVADAARADGQRRRVITLNRVPARPA